MLPEKQDTQNERMKKVNSFPGLSEWQASGHEGADHPPASQTCVRACSVSGMRAEMNVAILAGPFLPVCSTNQQAGERPGLMDTRAHAAMVQNVALLCVLRQLASHPVPGRY